VGVLLQKCGEEVTRAPSTRAYTTAAAAKARCADIAGPTLTDMVACICPCLPLQPKYEAYMKLFEPLCGPPPQRPILTEGANKVRN
jgi:hypothetical protein